MSNLADGVVVLALPLLAVRLTDSPLEVASVMTAMGLPWLLFSLQAGALADRMDRRWMMVVAGCLRVVVMAALSAALFLDVSTIVMVSAAAFVLGTAETVFDTSAQSLLPAVVPRNWLAPANSRLAATELAANELIGPPVAGALAAVAILLPFVGGGAAYLCAAVLLAFLPGSFRVERTEHQPLRTDIVDGVRYLRGHFVLRSLALATAVVSLAWSAWLAVFVLYAVGEQAPMGLSETGYGLMWAVGGVAGIAGSALVGPAQRALGRARLLGLCIACWAIFLAGPALTPNPWIVGVLVALGMFSRALFNIVAVSLRQTLSPDALLGRVNAGYRMLSWGVIPIGAFLGGSIAELTSVAAVFAIAAVTTGLLAVALLGTLTEYVLAEAESSAA